MDSEDKDSERDLWISEDNIEEIVTQQDALNFVDKTKLGLMVIYAPWCKYCQAMEAQYSKLSTSKTLASLDVQFSKYRISKDK